MTQSKQLSRRDFLKYSAATAAIMLTGPKLWAATSFKPDIEIKLVASRGKVAIFSGEKTAVSTYTGELLKGPASTLQHIKGSYLGPVIRVQEGQKIRIHFVNNLNEESIIHWHGLHIPEKMDGHPKYAVAAGKNYVYEFEVKNRAAAWKNRKSGV